MFCRHLCFLCSEVNSSSHPLPVFLFLFPCDADFALCCDPAQISTSPSTVNPQFLFFCFVSHTLGFPSGLAVKMGVPSLGWEDPLEKEMATHSSILVWEIPWTEEPGGLQSMGSQELDPTQPLNHPQPSHTLFPFCFPCSFTTSGFYYLLPRIL